MRTQRKATNRAAHPSPPPSPNFGLVCITSTEQCRFRTITRTRFLALSEDDRRRTLAQLYWDNLARLHAVLTFCHGRGIRLYRATSGLFPMSDDPLGAAVLESLSANLSSVGRRVKRLGIRVVLHPDQFVVLNSDSPNVAATSRVIMDKHARAFDLLGLPRSAWSAMILHGGKGGRGDELVRVIRDLPANVRRRLVLENDEFTYGAAEILDICRRAKAPMVFDCHHHVIKEGLDSYDHPSVEKFTKLAAKTWPDPSWQIVHLSNGSTAFADRNHSEFISAMPSAYATVPWIEVEARGKECAIEKLRESGLSTKDTKEHEGR
ncbi:MAG: UV damage endonuclease UvsE [Planctomycetota bacterium]|nr:UV damage endonuclease UvsE [Planctomycetota bacterium]